MVLGHQPIKIKEYVADEVRSKERIEYQKETYYVIEDFVLRVDHIPVYMSQ